MLEHGGHLERILPATMPPLPRREHLIACDAVRPGEPVAPRRELIRALERSDKHFLSELLGLGARKLRADELPQPWPESLEERIERGAVSVSEASEPRRDLLPLAEGVWGAHRENRRTSRGASSNEYGPARREPSLSFRWWKWCTLAMLLSILDRRSEARSRGRSGPCSRKRLTTAATTSSTATPIGMAANAESQDTVRTGTTGSSRCCTTFNSPGLAFAAHRPRRPRGSSMHEGDAVPQVGK